MTMEEFWWLHEEQANQVTRSSGAMTKAELVELDEFFEANKHRARKVKHGR
jgi:hypothetical protein